MFIGKTDAEAEAPVLWPPDAKSWLTGKDLDARKDWGQEEKGATEDEMVGWHHQLNGHESEQILGDSEGQRSLVCAADHRSQSRRRLSAEQQLLSACWSPILLYIFAFLKNMSWVISLLADY